MSGDYHRGPRLNKEEDSVGMATGTGKGTGWEVARKPGEEKEGYKRQ
jgi:hypothetical protein